MISRASGSLTAIRALLSGGDGWADAARRFLSPWAAVRLGAVSLLVGGVAATVAAGLQASEIVRSYSLGYGPANERVFAFVVILYVAFTLLLPTGLLGLYAALTKRRRWVGRVAATGAFVVAVAGVGFCVGVLYEYLARPVYYGPPTVSQVLFLGGVFGQPAGAVLLGVAALWTRGLGYWRALPLVVGLVGSPLTYILLAYLFLSGDELAAIAGERMAVVEAVVFSTPPALAGLGWFAVGLTLFGVRKREAALLEKDLRAAEKENSRKARDLYEKAFDAGDLSVVDEVAAPDLLDRRNGVRGPEAFKRTILGLRRAFPDLRLSVEGQTAKDETVTTRCSFSGTDTGGFLWYPPTNRRATFSVAYTDRFSGGKLVEHDGESDAEGLLRQLGLSADG